MSTTPLKDNISEKEIIQEHQHLLTGVWLTDLSNTSALINQYLKRINWVGFYLVESALCIKNKSNHHIQEFLSNSLIEEVLYLGPFQGLPACTTIPFSKGVCGTAAAQKKTLIVGDVHEFPGHIACDSRSQSEIVIPLVTKQGKVIGVLDVDSPDLDRFHETETHLLEQITRNLMLFYFL